MIHLHVRDRDGKHTLDAEAYREAMARNLCRGRRSAGGSDHQEAVGAYSAAEQMAVVLETNPEAVSLALREFVPDKAGENDFAEFLARLKLMQIWPQIILYSPDEAARLGAMRRQGLIPFKSVAVLYVLGRFALGKTSAPADILPFIGPDMPRLKSWTVCAFGRREIACVSAAALLGGHARVGSRTICSCPRARWRRPTPSRSARLRAPRRARTGEAERRRPARGNAAAMMN